MIIALTSSARADRPADLAFEVGEHASPARGKIVAELMTFQVGRKCWDKLVDKKLGGIASTASYAHSIADLAQVLTGDDWLRIEGQSVNTRERNLEMVSEMIAAFRRRFHVTIQVEGDDCDATGNALWLNYLGTTLSALKNTPPRSGKAFVTIRVLAKAKGVKTEVDRTGSKFTITAARDIEQSGWPNEIEKPIKRVSK